MSTQDTTPKPGTPGYDIYRAALREAQAEHDHAMANIAAAADQLSHAADIAGRALDARRATALAAYQLAIKAYH